ncbi:hypothetical protein NHX12_017964 [Muraenolepis orangiensis]|uniref:Ion transport domain-containing protein n=1 Tax=Muraenolepis orangiensis TaxID=630683 RepID=A0A9Q0EYP1_9TELE|nr:hypothetical protein NHX12_017964 [Muraenolepis orangiensis]
MFQPCDQTTSLMQMMLKMIALGILGQTGYLGDTWNRLDFFIVIVGMLEYSLDGHNVSLSAIRTVRVLRPLRAINRVPSMRILVTLLLDTLPMLGNLWAGLLRNRCFMGEDVRMKYNVTFMSGYYRPDISDNHPFICSTERDNGMLHCSAVPRRRVGGTPCLLAAEDTETEITGKGAVACVNWFRYYNECRAGDLNPHKGAISFDNIGYAWIAIFQVITLEGWVDIMYYVMDAHSFYNFIYFIFLIIFSETKQREHALMKSEQRARQLHQSASTLASDSQPGSCYEEIIRYLAHLGRKAWRRLSRFCGLRGRRWRCPEPPQSELDAGSGGHAFNYPVFSPLLSHLAAKKQPPKPPLLAPDNLNKLPQRVLEHGETPREFPPPCPFCLPDNVAGDANADAAATGVPSASDEVEDYTGEHPGPHGDYSRGPCCGRKAACPCTMVGRTRRRGLWRRCKAGLQKKLKLIVGSRYFNRGIMIAILINTLSMGIEYHEQPQELTDVLEISNMVFTSLFSLEMLLKLMALGLFGYIKNPYNGFDSVIVIISVWELVGEADGGLSVLRTFRLLRVLKLVRFLPALRRQLVVLMKTMDNVATFCMLLMLFIFIFRVRQALKFGLRQDTGDTLPDRKNFDSLLWATVTILTQEDWNAVLYNGMASTTPLAALYFVLLMTFGNYVLFNLLVAILVEGFQAEGDANRSEADEERQSISYDEEEKLREIYAAELKIQAMMLSPNGLLNPRASMPQAPAPPIIIHTAATPIMMSSQSRRASGVSMDINVYDQRSLKQSLWDANAGESSRSSSSSVSRAPSLHRRSQSGEMESLLSDGHATGSGPGSREPSLDLQPDSLQVPALPPAGAAAAWTGDCNGTAAFPLADRCHDDTPPTAHNYALERPDIEPHSTERVFLSVSNHVFTLIFVVEMLIKAPQLVVETLITSLRPIGNIVLICCAFFIVFGILGVQLFKGKFFLCEGKDVSNIANKTQCLEAGLRWVRRKYNFDNLGQALMSGPAAHQEQQPLDNFHKCRQQQEEEEARIREEKRQRRLAKRRRRAQEKPYYADYPPWRKSIHTLVTNHYLDLFITVTIFTNLLTMSMEHYQQPQYLDEILKYCNYVFTWNQLDLAIVLLSIMGITLEEIDLSASLPINPTIIRIMRVLRIARVLKLLKMATGMRSLLDTVMQALPQVGNLGLLFMLLFFIYAALGVELFGKLECSEENPCEGLSRHATFDNFGMAFLTLFRVSTGDNWNGIMKDTLRECRPGERHCLSYLPLISPLYFVTFVLTAQFVLVNVVVAESAASGVEAGPRELDQVEVVEDEGSHGNLMSIGRMLSLPSDSCIPPFRCSPRPPIGYDIYTGYSYSGSVSSLASSGAGSQLQVPGALPLISHASLGTDRSCRPVIRLSPTQNTDIHSLSGSRHTLGRIGPALSIDGYRRSSATGLRRHRLNSAHSVDGYRLSAAGGVGSERPKLTSAHSIDGYRPGQCGSMQGINRHSASSSSPAHDSSRRSSNWLSPEDSLDRTRLSPSYVPEGSAPQRPSSFRTAGRLRRQEAIRCDSLDHGGGLADEDLQTPQTLQTLQTPQTPQPDPAPPPGPGTSSPSHSRSPSVHTLKYAQPQRVIASHGYVRRHSAAALDSGGPPPSDGDTRLPPAAGTDLRVPVPEVGEARLPPAAGTDLRVPVPEPAPKPGRPEPGGLRPDIPEEVPKEVDRISGVVGAREHAHAHSHTHTQPPPGPPHQRRRLSLGPPGRDHRGGPLSQSVSPVSGRNIKQRMSPPPGEEPISVATQLMDSSVKLRRRTLSFDSTCLSPHLKEGESVED